MENMMSKSLRNEGDQTIGPLFEIMQGVARMAILRSVLDSNICDILQGEKGLDQIAQRMKVKADTDNLRYFLDAAACLGLIDKKNGCYFNNPFGEAYLCRESPTYMGELVSNLSAMQHRNLNSILDLVVNGPPEVKAVDKLPNEQKWKRAVGHLISYQKAGVADIAVNLIESLPEFKCAATLLDLGGGPGYVCMEALRRNSRLKGVLFDLPAVIKEAEKVIEKEGFGNRMATISGDYNDCELGKDRDIIWACQSLYYVKHPTDFYQKLYDSLSPQGVFLSLHEGLTDEDTRPGHIVLSRLSLALEGQDVSFRKGWIRDHLFQAGFRSIEGMPVNLPMGELELVVARKRGE